MTVISMIAAVARNGVIGGDGVLPWHLPEDLKHFREVTHGHPVIMGRKTWDSLPARFRPLPGRRNIVVTRRPNWHAEGALTVPTPAAALALAADAERVFVIGGAELYETMLPLADELLLTEIERDFDGAARFPAFARRAFAETARARQHAAPPNDFDFAWVTYRRRPR